MLKCIFQIGTVEISGKIDQKNTLSNTLSILCLKRGSPRRKLVSRADGSNQVLNGFKSYLRETTVRLLNFENSLEIKSYNLAII